MVNRDGIPADVAISLNNLVYRNTSLEVRGSGEDDMLDDPRSAVTKRLDAMVTNFRKFSVNDRRIGAAAAVALIDAFGNEPRIKFDRTEVWNDEAEARLN